MCKHTIIDAQTGRCCFCDSADFLHGPPLLDLSGIVKPCSSAQAQSILGTRLSAARDTGRSHLVLDLDNTLVVSVSKSRMLAHCKTYGVAPEQFTEHPDTLTLDSPADGLEGFYCKMRPGLKDFLRSVSKRYVLYMYTMGVRSYAQSVLQEIDPDGQYFGNRFICRDDVVYQPGRDSTQKYLAYIFGAHTEDVIVVDDRSDVWEAGGAFHQHVIQVPGYRFFPDVNMFHNQGYDRMDFLYPHAQLFIGKDQGTAISTLFENDTAERTLAELANILLCLQTKRMTAPRITLPGLWAARRSKVFANCEIYPENFMPKELLRAFCYEQVSNTGNRFGAAVVPFYRRGKTTHILCNPYRIQPSPRKRISGLTDQDEVYLVHPNWFYDCIRLASPLDEAHYLIEY